MTKSRPLFVALSVTVVGVLMAGSLALSARASDEASEQSPYQYLSVFTEVLNLVRQGYVEPTAVEDLFAGALDGAADALDPFSTYVPASEAETFLANQKAARALSGLILAKERGIVYAASVAPGSPAAEAEIDNGDILSRVQGRSTRELPLWQIGQFLSGPEGGEVVIETLSRGEPEERAFELAAYELPAPSLEERKGVAVMTISGFSPETVVQVREHLETLEASGQDRLLIDLRGAASTECELGYDLGRLFVSGELGELRNRSDTLETFSSDFPPIWSGELVVLVDRASMGVSELLVEILRLGADATVVGQRTFGYAGRHGLVELESGGRLFLAQAYYSGPGGERIEGSIHPDLAVTDSSRSFGEQGVTIEDLTLERGLSHLLEAEAATEREAA